MDAFDEIQVATNFKAGDATAFKTLFELFFPRITGFAQALIGKDNAIAEDITMESFSKLFRKYQDFDSIPNIRAFLYITTRNACLDHLRYSLRQEKLSKQWAKTVEHESFIELKQVEGEMFNAVKEAISQLPKKCRRVIEMIYLEGLGTTEIAARLSISIPTVRSQKRHGITLLRAVFADKRMVILLFVFLLGNINFADFVDPLSQRIILLFIQVCFFYKILTSFFARS